MAKQRNRPKPESIQVPDGKGGLVWYDLQVFLINTRTNGHPRLCTRLPEKSTIDLAGGEEFMTVYVPRVMLEGE